jgi:ProP effector
MPQDVNPLLDRLCAAFPTCFSRSAPKPLKIGLGEELLALAGVHPALADLTRTQLRRALKVYTGSPAYRKALAKGGPRYGLDGQAAGEVTPEQQTFARTPRPKKAAAAEAAAAPPPTNGYLKMTLKRRVAPDAGG